MSNIEIIKEKPSNLGLPILPHKRLMKSHNTIYAIGDIHGCDRMLRSLLSRLAGDHYRQNPGTFILPKIVLLGDYMDRGPNSKKTMDLLTDPMLPIYYNIIALKGNHEQELIDLLRELQTYGKPDPRGVRCWLDCGGKETLTSYGYEAIEENVPDFLNNLPVRHWSFLQTAIPMYMEGNYFFCHAGVDPDYPLEDQLEEVITGCDFDRKKFTASTKDYGLKVVHGHTPTKNRKVEILANRINIDTGAGHGSGVLSAVALRPDGNIDIFYATPA